jgi:Cu+-exporting ATPase
MDTHAQHHDHSGHHHTATDDLVVRDPVCGMIVDPAAGKPSMEYDGGVYHFCCDGCRKKFEAEPQDYLTAEDPVCGMTVDRATARHFLRHQGEKHYFCSAGCKAKFEAEPNAYRDGSRPPPKTAPAGTQYTCPMHPEVITDHPADCPKCGMALEPMGIPPADAGPNPELADFTHRLWMSAAMSVPLLAITMGPMVGLPVRDWIGEQQATWVELLLATPVVLWAALPFFRRAWASLVNRSPNMWTLIGLGVGAAYLYSVVATLVPGIFPHTFRSHGDAVPVYFEAAAVIVALVFVGQVAGTARARKNRIGYQGAAQPCSEDGAARGC